jgi:hypothetical protein
MFWSLELFRVYVAVNIRMEQSGTVWDMTLSVQGLLYYCLQQGRTLFSSLSSFLSYGADS